MKSKLKKTYKKRFDYTMRKLGFISVTLMVMSFALVLPIYRQIKDENKSLNQNLEVILQRENIQRKESIIDDDYYQVLSSKGHHF